MKTIRSSIFETNSSSVHAIVVSKTGKLDDIPEETTPTLELFTSDFGWEIETYRDFYSKLCYLLNGCQYDDNGYREKIEVFLYDLLGVDFIEYTPGYIDHNNIMDLLKYVTSDFNNFKQFLCCRNSFIQTGNDNCDNFEVNSAISEYSDKPDYEVFIKDN